MQTRLKSRVMGLAILTLLAVALAGCGGPKRTVTTAVSTTTVVPAATAVPSTTTPSTASASASTARQAAPAPTVNGRMTRAGMVASAVGFGIIGQAVVDQEAAAAGAGLARATGATAGATAGGQCQNPFGSQAASTGQLICSSQQERLQCQCDANGCQLVPTGIMACLPVGAVYQ